MTHGWTVAEAAAGGRPAVLAVERAPFTRPTRLSSSRQTGSDVTDTAGQATFTFTNTGGQGTDTITARFETLCDSVTKTFEAAAYPLTVATPRSGRCRCRPRRREPVGSPIRAAGGGALITAAALVHLVVLLGVLRAGRSRRRRMHGVDLTGPNRAGRQRPVRCKLISPLVHCSA